MHLAEESDWSNDTPLPVTSPSTLSRLIVNNFPSREAADKFQTKPRQDLPSAFNYRLPP